MSKILVSSASQAVLKNISALLKKFITGCSVITAKSGKSCIKKAEKELPDVLLLDTQMSDMDGYDVCIELKAENKTSHIPVVMLIEAQRDTESSKKALKAGADAFLAMPVNEDAFVMQVNAMLRIKNAEDALRKKEQGLGENGALRIKEFALSSSINGIAIADLEGKLTYVNKSLLDMWKHSEEEMLGKRVTDFFKEPEMAIGVIKALKTKGHSVGELTAKRDDGSLFTVLLSANLVKDQGGNPVCMMGSVLDLSERKQAEEALKESEEKFRTFAEQTILGMYIVKNDRVIFSNEGMSKIHGYTEEEVLSWDIDQLFELIHPDDRTSISEKYSNDIGTDSKFLELRFISKSKEIRWIQLFVKPVQVQDQPAIYGIAIDVTERRQAEETLKENTQFAEKLVNTSSDIIYIYDLVKKENVYANEGITKALGYTEAEAKEMGSEVILKLMHPEDFRDYLEGIVPRYALLKDDELIEHDYRMQHKDGDWRWLRSRELIYRRQPDGSSEQIFGIVQDITERKQAEAQILTEKKFTDTALDAQLDPFFLFEPATGKALRWNRAFKDISGYSDEEIAAQPAPESYYSPEDLERVAVFIQDVLKEGTGTIELELVCKNGSKVPTEYLVSTMMDEKGELRYLISIGRNITNRKQAEEALLKERDRAQKYLDIAGVMLIALDSRGCITLLNKKGCEILECTEEEALGKNWFDSFQPGKTQDEVKGVFNQLMSGDIDPVESFENTIVTVRGNVREMAWHNNILNDARGNIIGALSSGEDITESKLAQDALKDSEERMTLALKGADLAFWDWNIQSDKMFINNRWLEMVGYNPGEIDVDGQTWSTLMHPDDISDAKTSLYDHLEGRTASYSHEYRARTKSGQWIWVADQGRVFVRDEQGNPLRMAGTHLDITERKQAEEALRESEQKFRIAVGQIPGAVWTTDTDLKFTMSLGTGLPAMGLKPGQAVGMSLFEFFDTHDPNFASIVMHRRALQGESVMYDDEFEDKHYQTFLEPLRNSEGAVTGVIGISFNVTDTKQAEKALIESEKKYRSLFDNIQDGIALHEIVLDKNNNPVDYIFLDINDAFEKQTGLKKEKLIGKKVTEALPGIEKDPADWIGTYGKVALSGQSISFENYSQPLQKWYTVSAYRPAEGQFATLLADITETKKAEGEIKASLKEKEVLLSEIHHRVKNNLQIISSLLNLQSRHLRDEHDIGLFKDTQNRVFTMAMIHEKLYESNELASVDFNEYIKDLTANLLHSYNVNSASVKSKIEVGDVRLSIDLAIPCAQIINELISNSFKHAFPAGGKGEVKIKFNRTKDGKYKLIISDNGLGFPEGVNFRKTESLGLKVVNSLTKQLRGNIELDSSNGAKYTLTF